jgi:hypothetical protein
VTNKDDLDCGISGDYSAFDHDFAADTYAVVTASTFSEFMFIPKTSTAANPIVNTRIKPKPDDRL